MDSHDPVSPPSGDQNRRRFLSRLGIGLWAFAAAIVGVPFIAFLLSPLLHGPRKAWRSVGAVNNFKVGDTVSVSFQNAFDPPWSGAAGKSAAWLRRESKNDFVAFAVYCTHLGCPVKWLSDAEMFMCPCHGGAFYKSGEVASGAPPKPLVKYPVRVRNGQVEIQAGPLPLNNVW